MEEMRGLYCRLKPSLNTESLPRLLTAATCNKPLWALWAARFAILQVYKRQHVRHIVAAGAVNAIQLLQEPQHAEIEQTAFVALHCVQNIYTCTDAGAAKALLEACLPGIH